MALGLPPRQETFKDMAAASSSEHEGPQAFRRPGFLLPASAAPQPRDTSPSPLPPHVLVASHGRPKTAGPSVDPLMQG